MAVLLNPSKLDRNGTLLLAFCTVVNF